MPEKNKSCLNEQYTDAIEKIYKNLKEAKSLFKSFPNCIKNVETEHERLGGHSLE